MDEINEIINREVDTKHHWVTEYRLAVVSTMLPLVNYVVAVAVKDWILPNSVQVPTEEEALFLAYYRDYKLSNGWLGDMEVTKIRGRGIVDYGPTAGQTFVKSSEGWKYRSFGWRPSADYYPEMGADFQFTIQELVDDIESHNGKLYPKWAEWKERHPF